MRICGSCFYKTWRLLISGAFVIWLGKGVIAVDEARVTFHLPDVVNATDTSVTANITDTLATLYNNTEANATTNGTDSRVITTSSTDASATASNINLDNYLSVSTTDTPTDPPSISGAPSTSGAPTGSPTYFPSVSPTTTQPTDSPSLSPQPSEVPTSPTEAPTTPSPSTNFPTVQTQEPTDSPTVSTAQPTLNPTPDPQPREPIVVGAYYYPWQNNHFARGEAYLRAELTPRHEIRLGEYDDRRPEVIQQHIAWSRQANIGVWVASYFGLGRPSEETLRTAILPQLALQDTTDSNNHIVKVALHYETKEFLKVANSSDPNTFDKIREDFSHICRNYVDHPHYYYIDGKPVVVLYLSRSLASSCALQQVVENIQRSCHHRFYIIGDHVWRNPPSSGSDRAQSMIHLDAITCYDIYGNAGKPRFAMRDGLRDYFEAYRRWKILANEKGTAFVPSVGPGYNDRAIYPIKGHPPMSRRVDPDSPEGSLFEESLNYAVDLTDSRTGGLLLVNSFNEWHEDSQIEPVDGLHTYSPTLYTMDLDYIGYGSLYLDILANKTRPGRRVQQRQMQQPEMPIIFTGEPYSTPRLGALYVTPNNHYKKSLRKQLGQTLPTPLLGGNYTNKELIEHDLQLSWQSNIHVWVVPWRHQDDVTNVAVNELFSHPWLSDLNTDHKIMLSYNVRVRANVANNRSLAPETLIKRDIQFLSDQYLRHDAYFQSKSGKPVLVLSGLSREWIESKELLWSIRDVIRSVALGNGIDIFLLGDQVWPDIPSKSQGLTYPLDLLDGVMPLGGMFNDMKNATNNGGPYEIDSKPTLDAFYDWQRRWRIAAWQSNGAFVPTVLPGFNDKISGNENRPLARGMKDGGESEGTFFEACLDRAKHLLDSELNNLMVINSFNNFLDDSQIYPVYGYPTDFPNNLTNGFWYEGYGETFVEILSERFGKVATRKAYSNRVRKVLPSTRQIDWTNWCRVRRRTFSNNSSSP